MRKSLADKIEQYIKALIDHSENKQIEIQRSELAETFACVPSQVTYVIATRFSNAQGFITESRRGGRGFVRIARCSKVLDGNLDGNSGLCAYLDEQEIVGGLSQREANLIKNIYWFMLHNLPYYNRLHKEKLIHMAIEEFLKMESK